MREIAIDAEAPAKVKSEPILHFPFVQSIYDKLFFHNTRKSIFRFQSNIIVRIKFLIALTEPCKRKRCRMNATAPVHVKPEIQSIATPAVSNRVIDKVGIGIIAVALFAIITAVIAAPSVFQKRKFAVV